MGVNFVGDRGPADELIHSLRRDGARAGALEAGVSDEGAVRRMVARARGELGGPVDGVVNNAAVPP